MPLQHNGQAPYTSPSGVTTIIERIRNGSLPTPVTSDVLVRSGVPESLAPRTLASLKLLELLSDDGEPSDSLNKLRLAKSDEFPGEVLDWLQRVYAEVFGIVGSDVDSVPLQSVEDAFRGYTPAGQRARMVTLFIGLLDYAGVLTKDSPLRAATRSAKRAPAKPGSKPKPKPAPKWTEGEPEDLDDGGSRRLSKAELLEELRRERALVPELHPFVQGLVAELPQPGSVWPEAKRKAWLAAAESAFGFMYELPDSDGPP